MSNNKEIKAKATKDVIASYNIYTKLQKLRSDFHKVELKKTGENKFAGFRYFELKDFLPTAVSLLEKYNLTTIMNTTTEGATLVLVNADKPEETITFFIPDAQCQLKGCTDIQSLGGKITYQKRYLYVNLLDVCENDMLDQVIGKEEPKTESKTTKKLTDKQVTRLLVLGKKAGFTEDTIRKQVKNAFNKEELNTLTKEEYDRACNGYLAKTETSEENKLDF